ncbi:MAG: hypothetical protein U0414_40155 [Polyangiaceae bacterium]
MLDADIRDYFGSIDHDKLMKLVEQPVSDRRVLKLLRQWLEAGVMEDGHEDGLRRAGRRDLAAAVEHLLARARYLDVDEAALRLGTLVRYADDFVMMYPGDRSVEKAEERSRDPHSARLGATPGERRGESI